MALATMAEPGQPVRQQPGEQRLVAAQRICSLLGQRAPMLPFAPGETRERLGERRLAVAARGHSGAEIEPGHREVGEDRIHRRLVGEGDGPQIIGVRPLGHDDGETGLDQEFAEPLVRERRCDAP